MRYFRASLAAYLSVCQQLDAAYGYPNHETKTLRTLPLASELSSDQQGRVYLGISAAYCDFVLPSQMIPELIAAGIVEEITQQQYEAVVPSTVPAT